MAGAELTIQGLRCRLGGQEVLRGVDLSVKDGEVCAVLGPSGSGKSTLLRCVAGLIPHQGGSICLGGEDLGSVPTHKRGLGMVFQNYSLWPHLTVSENVALPLTSAGIKGAALKQTVTEALGLVQLAELANRRPGSLSGGQKQRVAIARAIARKPRLLLLDEPLSNLDRALRQELLFQLRELNQKLALTTLFVTHDQQEAMTLGHTVAVLRRGELAVQDTPAALRNAPPTLWLARFLGDLNVLAVSGVRAVAGGWELLLKGGGVIPLPPGQSPPDGVKTLGFRSSGAVLSPPGEGGLGVEVTDHWLEERGEMARCRLTGGEELTIFSSRPVVPGPACLYIHQPLFFAQTAGDVVENL